MRNIRKFNLPVLAVSLLAGGASWAVCALIYDALVQSAPRPALIGLMFGILALAVAAGVFLVSYFSGTFQRNLITGGSTAAVLAALAVILVLVAAVGALFQWLYSLRDGIRPSRPTSYVFLIDDSGSMSDSDPHGLRYTAIDQALAEQDGSFPYMVYSFASRVTLRRPMGPVSAGGEEDHPRPDGQTAIRGVLERVISDYEQGLWTGGAAPKVVLLSDGVPTDFTSAPEIDGILERYRQAGITISTVGMEEVDAAMMTHIATSTGGVYVDIHDSSGLGEAMSSAARRQTRDDLFTARTGGGPLYGALRVLFLALLGVAVGLTAAVAYGQLDCVKMIFLTSLAKSVLGALLMELGTSLLALPERGLWLVLWLLIAATLCTREVAFTPRPSAPSSGRRGRRNRSVSGH